MKKKKITSAVDILKNRFIKDDPDREASVEEELINSRIAHMIYKLRTEKDISQKALAKKINTTQSVISRLEDSDYKGHSLAMLQKICIALGRKINITVDDEIGNKDSEIQQLKIELQQLKKENQDLKTGALRRIEIKVDEVTREMTELRTSVTSDGDVESFYDKIKYTDKKLRVN